LGPSTSLGISAAGSDARKTPQVQNPTATAFSFSLPLPLECTSSHIPQTDERQVRSRGEKTFNTSGWLFPYISAAEPEHEGKDVDEKTRPGTSNIDDHHNYMADTGGQGRTRIVVKRRNSRLGGGHYLVGGSLDVQFAFSAIQYTDGRVAGSFHDRANDGLGLVDFDADVTCLAVDHDLGRAWIGGVITANRSTSPDFTDTIYQPGHDVWFRVLDSGQEGNQPGPENVCWL
jgi:hypothetical protein